MLMVPRVQEVGYVVYVVAVDLLEAACGEGHGEYSLSYISNVQVEFIFLKSDSLPTHYFLQP